MEPLRKHQFDGIDFGLSRPRAALFMEPGTGKTRTAIEIISRRQRREGKLFFAMTVCPVSALYTWTGENNEFEKWGFHDIQVHNLNAPYDGNPLTNFDINKHRIVWFVISFGMLRSRWNEQPLATIIKMLDAVVVDESIYIKNPEAQITQVIATGEKRKKKKKGKKKTKRPPKPLPKIGVFENVRFKYILSGLPITRHLSDIYGQYRFLSKTIFGDNFYKFRNHYFTPDDRMFDWVLRPDRSDKLQRKYNAHSYRVKKADVLHDLPDKIQQIKFAELSDKTKKVYNHLKEHWCLEIDEQLIDIKWAFTLAQKLQQLTSGIFIPADQKSVLAEAAEFNVEDVGLITLKEKLAKTPILPEPFSPASIVGLENVYVIDERPPKITVIKELLQETPEEFKFVIWVYYRADLALIYHYLSKHKGVYYHGGTSPASREEAINAFIHDPTIRMIVLQVQAGMTSINLQKSHNVIYYSHTHDYNARRQSEDRNHRMGQKNSVVYNNVFVRGTVDDLFAEAYARKMGLMDYLESASEQGGKVGLGRLLRA